MSELAVRVEGLGKRYHLGKPQERYSTLRDQIGKLASAPLRALYRRGARSGRLPSFWALKDVSFEVGRGEVVGIIGRNGAGKSTLLKILSRITEPTEGLADIHGRVSSLLEVGTGFHPELTGRENVFLNGAILGMRREEITRKFDEIVAFAEVEQFIDTPVKHYSSGMYMRLAFAVAAHLEPEILVVDEVLAVGDAQFQKKCLGRMRDVSDGGRTVLFVSHNMSAIQSLCHRAVLLNQGRVQDIGAVADIIPQYMAQSSVANECDIVADDLATGIFRARVDIDDDPGRPEFLVTLWVKSEVPMHVAIDVRLTDMVGTPVAYGSLGAFSPSRMVFLRPGVTRVVLRHDMQYLALGSYLISLDLTRPDLEYVHRAESCLGFECATPTLEPGGKRVEQGWQKGSWELPTTLREIVHLPPSHAPTLNDPAAMIQF